MEPSVFRSLLTTRHIVQYKELLETLLWYSRIIDHPGKQFLISAVIVEQVHAIIAVHLR